MDSISFFQHVINCQHPWVSFPKLFFNSHIIVTWSFSHCHCVGEINVVQYNQVLLNLVKNEIYVHISLSVVFFKGRHANFIKFEEKVVTL